MTWVDIDGSLAQLVRASVLHTGGRKFESCRAHKYWKNIITLSHKKYASKVTTQSEKK